MHKFKSTVVMIGLLSGLSLGVAAESLFEQLVKRANPDSKTLLESKQMVKNHQDIKILHNLTVPPFHKRGENSLTLQDSNAYCTECHLPLPHQAQLRSRSFLNMHVAYIACETCHLRPEGLSLEYRWLSYDGGKSRVEDARFHAGISKKPKSAKDNDQQVTKARPPRLTTVKIAPFYQDRPALVFRDSPFAQLMYQQWKEADETAKGQLRAKLHMPLEKTGPECTDCHTDQDSLLDFIALGATSKQKRALERNTIADFFAHYKSKPEDLQRGGQKKDKNEERIRITDLLK